MEKTPPIDINKTPFNLFVDCFCLFAMNQFKAPDHIIRAIQTCSTEEQLGEIIKKHKDDIYTAMGGELESFSDLHEEIDKLNKKIDYLKYSIDNLEGHNADLVQEIKHFKASERMTEDEIIELEDKLNDLAFDNTIVDTFKLDSFRENYHRYTHLELDELLTRGKELLKK